MVWARYFPWLISLTRLSPTVLLDGYPLEALFLYDADPVFETPGGCEIRRRRLKKFLSSFPFLPLWMIRRSTPIWFCLSRRFLERWQDDYFEGSGLSLAWALRQPVVQPVHDTQNTADFLLNVAQEMGGPVATAFPWSSFEELLQERLADIGTDWDTLVDLGVWLTPGYRYSRRGSDRWIAEVVGSERRFAPRDGRFDFYSREMSCLLADLSKEQLADMGTTVSGDAIYLPHYETVEYAGSEEDISFAAQRDHTDEPRAVPLRRQHAIPAGNQRHDRTRTLDKLAGNESGYGSRTAPRGRNSGVD